MSGYLRVRYRLEYPAAVLALVVLAPVLAAVALWVWVVDRGPVLFRQVRVAPDGTDFEILKFRTFRASHDMADLVLRPDGTLPSNAGEDALLPGARRIRALGIDELPQLVNIARGEMSFIGPRPLPVHLRATQAERAPIRLGVLGLAQARTRRALPLADRLDLDNRYARSAGPRMDATILLNTLRTVAGGTE